jgi:type VI secretion system secreted protein Hcp
MPGNAFIKFTGPDLKGEGLQEGHAGKDGWIEIGDWGWDIEAEASHLKGTGAAVGKPQPAAFTWSHFYDKSSPQLMEKIVMGSSFAQVQIDILKQTGGKKPEVFLQMIAKDVFITKVSNKGGEDGAVSQDIEMVFKDFGLSYKRQDNKENKLAAPIDFRWNIAEMSTATSKVSFKF